jgi:hypothetical protein
MELSIVAISEDELDEIKDALDARLDIFRGKNTAGGDVDTLEMTRQEANCDDLADSAEFQSAANDYDPASVDFLFDYDSDHTDIRVRISTLNGSIWFRSTVPEEVIEHVYGIVRGIKGW